jgi:hypothetical protein
MRHWWEIPLFIIGAPLGVYLWSASPATIERHTKLIWRKLRSK